MWFDFYYWKGHILPLKKAEEENLKTEIKICIPASFLRYF